MSAAAYDARRRGSFSCEAKKLHARSRKQNEAAGGIDVKSAPKLLRRGSSSAQPHNVTAASAAASPKEKRAARVSLDRSRAEGECMFLYKIAPLRGKF